MQRPQYLFPDGARFGAGNLLLHARATRHAVKDFPGPLSIKGVIDGQVSWIVDGRHLVVDSSSFLVLNAGQKYSMDVDVPRPIETCCAFFVDGFVELVAQDATTPLQSSLDGPARKPPSLDFLSRLHRDTRGSILARLRSLAQRCSEELQPSGFEEDFLLLSEQLVMLYDEVAAEMSRVPAAKASTREELFRRLQLAREYLHGQADGQISLQDVSNEACLSRYHLHRAFTRVFRQTPHAYLTALRLERAHAFLKSGRGVMDTCLDVGFSSPSTFSRLFSRHYGFPPSAVHTRGRRR